MGKKQLSKEEQKQPKLSRRKEIIKIKARLDEKENKKLYQIIIETKLVF